MNNETIYNLIKENGIKQVAKNFFVNLEDEHWIIWLKNGDSLFLNKNFFNSYSLTSCFEEGAGELSLKYFTVQKIPKKARKKAIKEQNE